MWLLLIFKSTIAIVKAHGWQFQFEQDQRINPLSRAAAHNLYQPKPLLSGYFDKNSAVVNSLDDNYFFTLAAVDNFGSALFSDQNFYISRNLRVTSNHTDMFIVFYYINMKYEWEFVIYSKVLGMCDWLKQMINNFKPISSFLFITKFTCHVTSDGDFYCISLQKREYFQNCDNKSNTDIIKV